MNFNEFTQKFAAGARKFFIGVWNYMKAARLELIVLAAVLAFDLITKAIVGAAMHEGQSLQLIPNFLYFTYVKNTKAAFSSAFGLEKILSDGAIRIIFLVITVIAVSVFSYFMWRGRGGHRVMRLAFSLIISGALGNFVDRLFLGYVRDFVHIVYFGLNVPLLGDDFAIFNVADAALTVGVVLFAVYYIFLYKDPKKADKNGQEPEQSADGCADGEVPSDVGTAQSAMSDGIDADGNGASGIAKALADGAAAPADGAASEIESVQPFAALKDEFDDAPTEDTKDA